MQNAHMESFHGKLREECRNARWLQSLWEAQGKIEAWRKDHSEERAQAVWDTGGSHAEVGGEMAVERRFDPPRKTLRVSRFSTASTAAVYRDAAHGGVYAMGTATRHPPEKRPCERRRCRCSVTSLPEER